MTQQLGKYDPTVTPPSPGMYDLGDVERFDVTFPSDGSQLAGHLYVPPTPSETGRFPGVVLDGPAPSIKEIALPAYAIRLARAGYLTLTFDRRGWGGSEGWVRQQMNPPENIRDIRNATTYLLSRDDVDAGRIAGVGVCTGGGFMLQAGALDRRYRAVACVAAFYGLRRVMHNMLGHDGWVEMIRQSADQRVADLRAGQSLAIQALAPESAPAGTAIGHIDEAYEFYTSRQKQIAPSWINELTTESAQNLLEFDAVPYAELVAPTPLLVIHGTVDPNTPPQYAQQVYDTAREPRQLVWIETTNHVQLYDVDPMVTEATTALTTWLDQQLSR